MNSTIAQRMKLISVNYENMVTGLTDIYRQLLFNILKNNQVTVDPNATLSQVWELAEPFFNDSYLKGSVLGLLEKPSVVHILFAWDWVDTSVKLYGGGLFSQIGTSIKKLSEDKSISTNAKDLQDFFEKVLVCLRHEFHGYKNSDAQDSEKQLLLTQVEKTLTKQRHRVWDVCLLKLAKASLKNDTLEVFGVVLMLLEFVKNPEVTSILPHENVGFNKSIAIHLNAIKTRISEFYTKTGPGDKLVYQYLIDFFTYLAKAQ